MSEWSAEIIFLKKKMNLFVQWYISACSKDKWKTEGYFLKQNIISGIVFYCFVVGSVCCYIRLHFTKSKILVSSKRIDYFCNKTNSWTFWRYGSES